MLAQLRAIRTTAIDQAAALAQTISAIDSLMPADNPNPKKAKASR
jgi:hypothetical protein